jgi:hypothetical protein
MPIVGMAAGCRCAGSDRIVAANEHDRKRTAIPWALDAWGAWAAASSITCRLANSAGTEFDRVQTHAVLHRLLLTRDG